MKGVRELRRRLAGVKKIEKITRAMELVATTKLRRLQDRALASRPYASGIEALIRRMAAHVDPSMSPLFTRPEKATKEALVVVGADKGLCGSFNSNLHRAAVSELRRKEAAGVPTALYLIGKRPLQFFRKVKVEILDFAQDQVEKMEYRRVRQIAEDLVKGFLDGRYAAVRVLYTRFRSMVSFVPTIAELLPIPREEGKTQAAGPAEAAEAQVDYIMEPSPREILDRLLPRFLEMQLYAAVRESLASEFAARRAAMKSATDNAKEVIGLLTQEYNKARQSGITAELLEVVSGAEALRG